MADDKLKTKLTLGEFTFDAFEIPESIPFGGSQKLVTHSFPGGARNVQAMGRDDMPIGWSGLFFGSAALDRARYLDSLRVAGGFLKLAYLDFSYQVVIEKFEASLRNAVRIPYTISLLVVQDNTKPVTTILPSGFDVAIRDDLKVCKNLGVSIGDVPLTGLLGTLDSAISSVSDFAKATTATIQSVVGPLGAVIGRVNTLIGSTASVLNSVATLGGILPGNPIAAQVQSMVGQVQGLTQYPLLVQTLNVANRMQGNLGGIVSSQLTQSLTVAGGTLFDIAAKQYGDATKWPSIAQANGLIDPLISGVQNLKIPTISLPSGGIPFL